jgi:hypothetical protein
MKTQTEFSRKCSNPECNKQLFYNTKENLNRAIRSKALCWNCSAKATHPPKASSVINNLFYICRHDASRAGKNYNRPKKEFSISREEYGKIVVSDCEYCGAAPKHSCKDKHRICPTNGIDRVDNEKGYIPGNCVPSCEPCNRSKLKRKVQEFLDWVGNVHMHSMAKGKYPIAHIKDCISKMQIILAGMESIQVTEVFTAGDSHEDHVNIENNVSAVAIAQTG